MATLSSGGVRNIPSRVSSYFKQATADCARRRALDGRVEREVGARSIVVNATVSVLRQVQSPALSMARHSRLASFFSAACWNAVWVFGKTFAQAAASATASTRRQVQCSSSCVRNGSSFIRPNSRSVAPLARAAVDDRVFGVDVQVGQVDDLGRHGGGATTVRRLGRHVAGQDRDVGRADVVELVVAQRRAVVAVAARRLADEQPQAALLRARQRRIGHPGRNAGRASPGSSACAGRCRTPSPGSRGTGG